MSIYSYIFLFLMIITIFAENKYELEDNRIYPVEVIGNVGVYTSTAARRVAVGDNTNKMPPVVDELHYWSATVALSCCVVLCNITCLHVLHLLFNSRSFFLHCTCPC